MKKSVYTIASLALIVPSFTFASGADLSSLATKITGYLNQARTGFGYKDYTNYWKQE